MSGLSQFEHKLEQMISGAFARAFRSAVQPVEISAALQRECDNNAQILSRDRRLVPNDFHVELSQTDLDRLAPYDTAMAEELVEPARRSTPSSRATSSPARSRSTSRPPRTSPPAGSGSAAGRRPRSPATPPHTQVRPAPARVLEVNGTRHPLQPARPGGRPRHRGRRAHQRPRASAAGTSSSSCRRAAGARRIEVRDLGSTNGMLVDGHRITHTGVHDGTEVKIGNTTMTVRVIEEDTDV